MTCYYRLIFGALCVCVFSLTLQLHKVGTQPAASSHAVVGVVDGEEVGGHGPSVSSRLRRQLAVCDGLAYIHTSGAGYLQHHMTHRPVAFDSDYRFNILSCSLFG